MFSTALSELLTFFVDNASSDGSVEAIKNLGANLQIVENKENLGFAGGHDAGLAVARRISKMSEGRQEL